MPKQGLCGQVKFELSWGVEPGGGGGGGGGKGGGGGGRGGEEEEKVLAATALPIAAAADNLANFQTNSMVTNQHISG